MRPDFYTGFVDDRPEWQKVADSARWKRCEAERLLAEAVRMESAAAQEEKRSESLRS